MKDCKYFRDGNTIVTLPFDRKVKNEETGEETIETVPEVVQTFPSINAAKRRSREIQMSLDGRLGAGSVRNKKSLQHEADERLLQVLQDGRA